MRYKRIGTKLKVFGLLLVLAVFILLICLNNKYYIFTFNISGESGDHQFRVLTWNICLADIENEDEQEDIARLIIEQDADFVLLNEFTLDSCLVVDSLLCEHYPYRVDANAKVIAGDVFYSKVQTVESGKINTVVPNGLYSKMPIGNDTLFVLGCHLAGNNYEGQIEIDDTDSLRRVKTFWGRYRHARKRPIFTSCVAPG